MVAQQVRWQMGDAGLTEPLDGPMVLVATFTMPRPKSAPKSRWAPDRRPDLSHLVRALEDAIVMGGGVIDDSQFVTEVVSKVYPHDGAIPGVTFEIRPAVRGEGVAA
jgi:Holliday junction resolvase RusA-like endonuclease